MHDVHKLRIDPKIHYDLLRFCQHTRLAFLARNVPPDAMMWPADVNFDPGRGDWGSGIFQQNGFCSCICSRSGLNCPGSSTLPWKHLRHLVCVGIGMVPHDCRIATPSGGLGISPLPSSRMAAFYSATAQMVSWLGSLPHVSQWVADQNLADPTWKCSSLKTHMTASREAEDALQLH